ncbi:fimbria/pilus periplasmic chaperone [Pseudomonas sp. NFXW11]|uniref:fimbria/pilus periplasmic chaperone n=1 Tax=Pseudomonas sp. NFXW11 TaxID=2819531 RepID=UPI003CE97A66
MNRLAGSKNTGAATSIMTRPTLFIALAFALFQTQAQAALALGSSRIIIQAPQTQAVVMVHNRSAHAPYLAQSWVENAQGQKTEGLPLVALPPIQRLESTQSNQLKVQVLPRVAGLPQDRETLFYLNVREIPPRSEKNQEGIQIALQRRVKLLYRPERIRPLNVGITSPWMSAVTLSRETGGDWWLNNVTPYHVTIIEALGDGAEKSVVEGFQAMELAPYSAQRLDGKVRSTAWPPRLVYINDFGGRALVSFNCRDDSCSVTHNSVGS